MNRVIHRAGWFFVGAYIVTTSALAQKSAPASIPDCGPISDQVLRCPKLGFAYKVPFGWVDRTEKMHENAPANVPEKKSGRTLLAVFERPPEARDNTVNPAVMIAVESRSAYPQLKTASDYFGPLSEIAEERGLKMDGAPHSFSGGGKVLVRGEFSSTGDKRSVHQTSLVLLDKGYILSFTFLSGSEDEIDSLIENLRFTSSSKKPTR